MPGTADAGTEREGRIACAAPIQEEGAAAVSARLLSQIVRSLPPDKEISLETDEKGATLTCSGGAYTMRVHPPDDFPRAAAFPDEEAFALPVKALTEGVEKVSVATANDEKRPVLGGISATVGGGRLRLVATDSYRLALYDAAVEKGPEQEKSSLIPARALREVARLAAGMENVEVALTQNAAHFRAGPVEISSRVIAGAFPEYKKIVPQNFERSYEVDVRAFEDTLARVNLFAARQSSPVPVKLAFRKSGGLEGGELVVTVKSPEIGEATEKIGVAVEEEFDAAFNGSYLADGLPAAANDGSVVLEFNDPMKPAIIRSGAKEGKEGGAANGSSANGQGDKAESVEQRGCKETLYLIMPMRDPDAG